MNTSLRFLPAALALAALAGGCRSPAGHRTLADRRAYRAIEAAQTGAFGRTEPFTIETPADTLRRRLMLDQHLPGLAAPDPAARETAASNTVVCLTLLDALQVAARNSRAYQTRKEDVFRTALDLDLERHAFRTRLDARLGALFSSDGATDTEGTELTADAAGTRGFEAGPDADVQIGLNLARLLSGERDASLGLLADASISIPLLRGSGRAVAREPLTQAERDTLYAIYRFEEFKRAFAVETADAYLSVLRARDAVRNAAENAARRRASAERARALADAGRLPEVEVGQADQDVLSAEARRVTTRLAYENALDAFKTRIGLPPDARLELDPGELDRLSASADRARMAVVDRLDPDAAVSLALRRRPDMRIAQGEAEDAERAAAVAADALRAELTLLGRASAGESRSIASAAEPDARLDPAAGLYSGLLTLDLPLDRTAERNAYRKSLIAREQARRAVDEQEDAIKLAVRNGLRRLREAADTVAIQRRALELAEQRETSTTLFLRAGRAQTRDLLEAQNALLSARDALTAAIVSLRVTTLELQRDLGILEVDQTGLWTEADLAAALDGARPSEHAP
jgi:outer membrane protein TolC